MKKRKTFKLKAIQPRRSSTREQSSRHSSSERERRSLVRDERDESVRRGRSLTRKNRQTRSPTKEREREESRCPPERYENVRPTKKVQQNRSPTKEREREIRRSSERESRCPPERERIKSLESVRSQHSPEREFRRSQHSPEREFRRSLYSSEREFRRNQYSPERERSTRRTSVHNNNDLEAMNRAIVELTKEVHYLKEKNKSRSTVSTDNNQRHDSFSPEPEGGYRRRARNFLEDMTEEQYKTFHDEVISILNGLDDTLQLDYTRKWIDISRNVAKTTMKEIDKAMNGRFSYKDTELKWVLQQLHRHRRESWKNSQDPNKRKSEKKRKGVNSRRGDKKERRQKGLLHLFNNNDGSFDKYQPSTLTADTFRKDCEQVFNDGAYHSDEVSETDEELCNKEIEDKIRPKNKEETDLHVLHVYDKKWRSSRVRNLLRTADKTGGNISHVKIARRRWYDDKKWSDNAKPPEDAPEWTISMSYNSDVE